MKNLCTLIVLISQIIFYEEFLLSLIKDSYFLTNIFELKKIDLHIHTVASISDSPFDFCLHTLNSFTARNTLSLIRDISVAEISMAYMISTCPSSCSVITNYLLGTALGSKAPDLSWPVSTNSKVPVLRPRTVFLVLPFRRLLLPEAFSSLRWFSSSPSIIDSKKCFINGARTPSLGDKLLPS